MAIDLPTPCEYVQNLINPPKPDDGCGDCHGSGWAQQFVTPCSKCGGTGKKPKS